MTTADFESMPVEGVKDWFKDKIKSVLLSYAKPYWDEIKAALTGRDFGKLADLVDKIGAVAGYVELAKSLSDLLRALAAKDYLLAFRKAADLFEAVVSLFKSAPAPQPANGGIMVSSDPVSLDIMATVDAMFDSPPTVGAAGDEIGPDGKPVGFGIVEVIAIISLINTLWSAWRKRRELKAG